MAGRSSGAVFIQLLLLQYWIVRSCLAITFQTLPLDSGLYIIDSPDKVQDGQYMFTRGSIIFSFRGTQFQFQEPFNPNATVGLSIDGKHLGTLNDGSFEEMGLADGDHQVLLEIQAPDTNPYVFRGIKLPVADGINLNATKEYIPQTYGINASLVPSDAKILDNTSPCVQFSYGWSQTNDWKSFNGSSTVSGVSGFMTIYFLGTSIWLFSSQGHLKWPQYYSLSGTIDSEDVTDLPPVSDAALDTVLTQKLLWSRTNLTNTLHVLNLYFSHSSYDEITFDFARVEQEVADCKLFISQSTDHPLSWDTMEILLLVCASSLFPIIFITCICFFRWRENKRVRRDDKKSLRFSGKQSGSAGAGGQKLDIEDDSSSFQTILNRTRRPGAGTRGARMAFGDEDDHPRAMTFPRIMVTPFGPVVLGQNEEPYRATAGRRNSKNPNPRVRAASVMTGDATDTISEIIESEVETGSMISSSPWAELELGPEPIPPIMPLQRRHSDSSLSPPPSYRTELPNRRRGRRTVPVPVGQARLLTPDDLGRLVDRVTVLRGWGGPSNTTSLRVENPAIDEEDDAVEMLARQIAESGSEGTRIRTVKGVE